MKQLDHAEACEQDEARRLWMVQEQTVNRLAVREGTIESITRSTREDYQKLTGASSVSSEVQQRMSQSESLLRRSVFSLIPNARIADLPGNTAGVQHDNDRRVVLDRELVTHALQTGDGGLLQKVAAHEHEHQLQQTGDATVKLSPIVSSRVGGIRELTRLQFRERGAMKAEGGVHKDTSQAYIQDYWKPVEQVRSALNEQGADGNRLVMDAGRTHAGFTKLVHALHQQNPALN